MRPIKLELEGFTAFRNRTEVNFEGAELFVFSGPTGSGKSSLIDAMTFALYGSISRYENPNLVYPIVSQGLQEARVRFDFDLNAKRYSVVRVVRRQQRGKNWSAVTKEARLECGKKTLAGNVKELDTEIQRLFGLSFEQFTTCVVLPQGEFARFLHEAPADRQDILKELLGIRIYEKMGQMARQREALAKQEIKLLQDRLKESVDFSPNARTEIESRIKRLKQLKIDVDRNNRELDILSKAQERLTQAATEEQERIGVLEKLRKPSGIDTLMDDQQEVEVALEKKKEERSEIEQLVKKEEIAFKSLPDKTSTQQLIDAHEDLSSKEAELEDASEDVQRSDEKKEKAQHALKAAEDKLEKVSQLLEEATRTHASLQLAQGLRVGDECPVCQRVIDKLPKHHKAVHVSDLKKERDEAKARRDVSSRQYQDASENSSAATAKRRQIQSGIDRLRDKIKKVPSLTELRKQLKNIEASQGRLDEARNKAEAARKSERKAAETVDEANGRMKKGWADFDRARDSVGKYEPPPADQNDLGSSWEILLRWGNKQKELATKEAILVATELKKVTKDFKEKESAIIDLCETEGIDVDEPDNARDEVVRGLAETEQNLKTLDAAVKERKNIQKKLDGKKQDAVIAGSLAAHLRASAFERWILKEAFDRLGDGGSKKLEELSSNDYSFQLDDQLNFDIVDHRNADEVRSVRTLSGGETFLASLALALTLAEQVAEMASEGAARLESIFLDEGFGALDSETLDLVATTIEELGSRGRMVGLVTHVKELAERIPTQFRVSKNQNSSTVERVSI